MNATGVGGFRKGQSGNPAGRAKRTAEEKFNASLLAVVTPERFQAATERQMKKAENGDLESYKYLCKLLGMEIDRKELYGKDGEALAFIIQERAPDAKKD